MLSQQTLHDLGSAEDIDVFQRRLVSASESLGFGLVAAVLIRGSLQSRTAWMRTVDNTPAAYLAAHRSLDDTLRDPVMLALQRSAAPMTYDQRTYVAACSADLWDLQAPWGYRAGVACSVHEPSHLEQFMLGVDRPDALPTDPIGSMRLRSAVQLLTLHAQAAMQRLLTPVRPGATLADLAADELECLQWTADGRSTWQIGDKLSITEERVVALRTSAAQKCGDPSVPAVVLRCIQGGRV